MEKQEIPVYSTNVIEFVTVANQYCSFVEQADETDLKDFIDKIHKLLPLLYLKATLLPVLDSSYDEFNEKYVNESDYNILHNRLIRKFDKYNYYQEVFDPLRQENDEPAESSIAENLADIYQDIKDFVLLYQIGTNEVMHNAIWECRQNFEQYWGQKVVNVLRALHHLYYTVVDLQIEENGPAPGCETDIDESDIDTSNWFITKRMEDFRDEE